MHLSELAIPCVLARNLAGQGVETVEQAVTYSRSELLGLHGVGPKGLDLLEDQLSRVGRALKA